MVTAGTSSPLDRWVLPSLEVATVGLPFCAFKLLVGAIAIAAGLLPVGYALAALGAVDLALNVVNLAGLAAQRRRVAAVCLADLVVRRLTRAPHRRDLGLAIDVFLSFALVAIAVGGGLLARLPAWAAPIWNAAVVLNVLGAGLGRLVAALRPPAPAAPA